MTPAEVAARYREYAAECLMVAQRQGNERDRLVLIHMAQAWMTLADQATKNQSLPTVYETLSGLNDRGPIVD